MKPIKFRAFFRSDIDAGRPLKFIQEKYEDLDGELKTYFVMEKDSDFRYDAGILFDDNDGWIFQQYTGVLDRNGQEIYDGDILKFGSLNYQVQWNDHCWKAVCPYFHKYHWPEFEYFHREGRCSKIVGNIIETPELLKL